MIIRAVKTYLTSLSPYGKEVDRRATMATANRAPTVYKSATRTTVATSSSSTNGKHSYIPSFRFAGPTAAAFASRLSYNFRRRCCCHRSSSSPSFLEASSYGDSVDIISPLQLLHKGRKWTNTLIAANVIGYIAQRASGGELLHWGAKTNDLISKRQLWRLVTSSFLHAKFLQLMASCYSLNTLGPGVENIYGPRRYLAVYITSAIAGSGMSYLLCKAATAGASGAIFGLMGSYISFLSRFPEKDSANDDDDDGKRFDEYLVDAFIRIIINLAAGMLYIGVDKWGNVGGLIGGTAVSWVVGLHGSLSLFPKARKLIEKEHGPDFSLIKRYNILRMRNQVEAYDAWFFEQLV